MPYKNLIESPERAKPRNVDYQSSTTSARSFKVGLHPIPQLQRTLGNRNIAQLIQAKRLTPEGKIIGLQRKLTVGAADDQYEQEADRVARQVMNTPDAAASNSMQRDMSPEEDKDKMLQTKPLAASITMFVQREMMNNEESEDKEKPVQAMFLTGTSRKALQRQPEEDKDKMLQTKPLAASITPFVQRAIVNNEESEDKEKTVQAMFSTETNRKPLQRQPESDEKEKELIQAKSAGSMSGSFEAGGDVETRVYQSKGHGSPLPDPVRTYMEPRFGVDFSHVRVHTGNDALQMTRNVGAQAFTHGSDIYFGEGRGPNNLELVAHELTHVIQQTGGPPLQTKKSQENSADLGIQPAIQRICPACAEEDKEKKKSHSISSMMLQRKVFTDTSVKGWTVSFNPTAAVTPDAGGQQVTHYDEDNDDSKFHQRMFDVAGESTGKIFIAVNMTWQGIGANGGGGGGTIPGLSKEDCKNLPPGIPDEIKKLCEIGGSDCKDNIDNASDAVILALCSALTAAGVIPGLICFGARLFGADKLLKDFLKKQICNDTPGNKQPPKQTVIASGKGNATLQVSYFVEKDGKMQVFGPGPISSSSGSGAQVVSPVQFTKEATPTGGEVSLAPMIHSVIGQQINDFQQLFNVSVRLPKPQPFSCCKRVFPFVVGTDKFQNEDAAHEQLFTWWQGLDPAVRKSVERGETPITVIGHASATGSQKFNLELSQKRANRVKNILQSFFGSESHPNVFAFGKLLAKQPGEVDEERRADVKISGQSQLENSSTATSCGATNQPEVCSQLPV